MRIFLLFHTVCSDFLSFRITKIGIWEIPPIRPLVFWSTNERETDNTLSESMKNYGWNKNYVRNLLTFCGGYRWYMENSVLCKMYCTINTFAANLKKGLNEKFLELGIWLLLQAKVTQIRLQCNSNMSKFFPCFK